MLYHSECAPVQRDGAAVHGPRDSRLRGQPRVPPAERPRVRLGGHGTAIGCHRLSSAVDCRWLPLLTDSRTHLADIAAIFRRKRPRPPPPPLAGPVAA
jgi:hypothetical protein